MGEGAIGLGHLVGVFLLLNNRTGVVVGVDNLGSQSVLHGDTLAAGCGGDDPAEREALLALVGDFNRDLVGRTTHAAALDLQAGTGVFQSADHQVNGITLFDFLGDLLNRTVDVALGGVLLAVFHDDINEMGNQRAVITDVRSGLALIGFVTA